MENNQQPYSIVNGEEFFDWNKFLDTNPEDYDQDDLERAESLSEDWITCACGNLCAAIPRDEYGGPRDHKLNGLGLQFNLHIHEMYRSNEVDDYIGVDMAQRNARETLRFIEQRSAELLKQINNGK